MIIGFSNATKSNDVLQLSNINVEVRLTGSPALVTVKSNSSINPTGLHFVYWDGEKIFDPSGYEGDYEIIEWCAITEVSVYDPNESLDVLTSRGFITNQLDLVRLARDSV